MYARHSFKRFMRIPVAGFDPQRFGQRILLAHALLTSPDCSWAGVNQARIKMSATHDDRGWDVLSPGGFVD